MEDYLDSGDVTCAALLEAAGFRVEVPDCRQASERPLYKAEPPPDFDGNPDGFNLASFVDKFVGPKIVSDPDFRPALVMCASKGGYGSVPWLWQRYWRGPTLVLHGFCGKPLIVDRVPLDIPLTITVGEQDRLSVEYAEVLKTLSLKHGLLEYRSSTDTHGIQSLPAVVLPLVEVTMAGGPLAFNSRGATAAMDAPPAGTFRFKSPNTKEFHTCTEAVLSADEATNVSDDLPGVTEDVVSALVGLTAWLRKHVDFTRAEGAEAALEAGDGRDIIAQCRALQIALHMCIPMPAQSRDEATVGKKSLYTCLALSNVVLQHFICNKDKPLPVAWLKLLLRFSGNSKEDADVQQSSMPTPLKGAGKGKGHAPSGKDKGKGKGNGEAPPLPSREMIEPKNMKHQVPKPEPAAQPTPAATAPSSVVPPASDGVGDCGEEQGQKQEAQPSQLLVKSQSSRPGKPMWMDRVIGHPSQPQPVKPGDSELIKAADALVRAWRGSDRRGAEPSK